MATWLPAPSRGGVASRASKPRVRASDRPVSPHWLLGERWSPVQTAHATLGRPAGGVGYPGAPGRKLGGGAPPYSSLLENKKRSLSKHQLAGRRPPPSCRDTQAQKEPRLFISLPSKGLSPSLPWGEECRENKRGSGLTATQPCPKDPALPLGLRFNQNTAFHQK